MSQPDVLPFFSAKILEDRLQIMATLEEILDRFAEGC